MSSRPELAHQRLPEENHAFEPNNPSESYHEVHKLSSKKRTVVNVLKSYVGAGVLAIPFAFAQGGLIMSIICYLAVAAVALYCMLLLLKVKRHIVDQRVSMGSFQVNSDPHVFQLVEQVDSVVSRKSLDDESAVVAPEVDLISDLEEFDVERVNEMISFEDVGQYLFGWWGRFLVDLCLLSSQLGFCVVYQIFLGDAISGLLPSVPKLLCMLLPVPVLVAVCQIRRLKWLAATSFVALSVFMSGFVIVLWFSVRRSDFGHAALDMGPRSLGGFATLISFAVFSFEGIGLVLPLENSVRPEVRGIFTKLFSATVGAVTLTYTLVGALGYVAWGREVGSSLLDNIIRTQGRSVWVILVIFGFLVGGFCSYPLNMYPVTVRLESLWLLTDPNGNDSTAPNAKWKRTALRTGLVLLALLLALAIPSFGLFISLIGSLFSTALAFVFPTLFHLKLFSWPAHWPTTPLNLSASRLRQTTRQTSSTLSWQDYITVTFDLLVFAFGILATIVCTVVSIQNIIIAIQNGSITWSFQGKPNS